MAWDERATRDVRALFYCDANLNGVDGSSIFVTSLCQVLSHLGVRTRLLLRARVDDPILLDQIEGLPHLTIVRAVEQGLADGPLLEAGEAARILDQLDAQEPADLVIVRSRPVARLLAESGQVDDRLWVYLLDVPLRARGVTDAVREDVARIAESAHLFLVQTEQLRAYLAEQFPATEGRGDLWSPVVPPVDFPVPARRDSAERPIRLGYMGKFSPGWNTLEMTRLPELLAQRGIEAEVHMVGERIHRDPADPTYQGRMREALESTPGVVWHGPLARGDVMRLMGGMEFGLAWRAASMDYAPEIQTKLLEFIVLGVPPLLRRTPLHEEMMGADYPLFAGATDELIDVVAGALADPAQVTRARLRCRDVAATFGFDSSLARMRALLGREFPGWVPATGP